MHVLAIDIGTHSIKYISSSVDRKKASHLEMSEIIIQDFMKDHPGIDDGEASILIVQEIINLVSRPDTKIIYQVDQRMVTTRFITLPVKSKKKAEMMLPFQLEEDLPFSLNDVHYSYKLENKGSHFNSLIEILKHHVFDPYYFSLSDHKILPNILTSESSIMENYFHQISMSGPFCILDIGHTTTKGYFFYNSTLLMSHISYVGGKNINEMIAENYKIPLDEAIQYKHEKAFFLSSSQYGDVSHEQRDFAQSMDKVFSPLTGDFLRWKIGFKINLGVDLQNIYICGGTANIKYIDRYLSEKWESKVILLETFDQVDSSRIDLKAEEKSNFALVNMMASAARHKNNFINILHGKYIQASATDLPLHSYTFIATRIAVVFFIFMLSLLTERFFINKNIKMVNLKVSKIVKNKDLSFSRLHQIQAIKKPQTTFSKLIKKQREVRQEISLIQSAIETNALSPLVLISQIAAKSPDTILQDFTSDDMGEVSATFSSTKLDSLKDLEQKFNSSTLDNLETKIDSKAMELTIKGVKY